MCSSRARASSKQHSTLVSVTQENYRGFTKEDIAGELQHYKELCLNLRKENYALKAKMDDKSKSYKESLAELQKKISRFNEKKLGAMEKETNNERERIIDQRNRDIARCAKGN
jgi:hypothetical protein